MYEHKGTFLYLDTAEKIFIKRLLILKSFRYTFSYLKLKECRIKNSVCQALLTNIHTMYFGTSANFPSPKKLKRSLKRTTNNSYLFILQSHKIFQSFCIKSIKYPQRTNQGFTMQKLAANSKGEKQCVSVNTTNNRFWKFLIYDANLCCAATKTTNHSEPPETIRNYQKPLEISLKLLKTSCNQPECYQNHPTIAINCAWLIFVLSSLSKHLLTIFLKQLEYIMSIEDNK